MTALPAATGLPPDRALDNPVWSALTGPHADFALRRGRAAAYPLDVSPFMALGDEPDEAAWADLAALTGPGGIAVLIGPARGVPADWTVAEPNPGVQLVASATFKTAASAAVVQLSNADVPEMLDLVARTKPGPFLPKTIELGRYLGIRRRGALVAMAGERLHLPGWTEISAVCTDPTFRGQGFATTVVRAVGAGIEARGETPMMHAQASNTGAINLYLALGFALRRYTSFQAVWAPASPG